MEETVQGPAFVVGDSVDTDQIIPAEHLVYSMKDPEERRLYGRYAMSAVPVEGSGLPDGGVPFTDPGAFTSRFSVIVAGQNFGCGSSREHAPFAIREAGCRAVVAESYARIFYRNCVDAGYLIPFETRVRLCERIRTGDEVRIDVASGELSNLSTGESFLLNPLGEVADILRAGDVFAYARAAGLITR